MTSPKSASTLIIETVTAWPGVSAMPGDRGSISLRLNEKRELAHLHGDHSAHFAFPRNLSKQLKQDGRVVDHPLGNNYQGLAARPIESDEDIEEVIALIRLNYDRASDRSPIPQP